MGWIPLLNGVLVGQKVDKKPGDLGSRASVATPGSFRMKSTLTSVAFPSHNPSKLSLAT